MPEGYGKPRWRLRPAFGLEDAAKLGSLIKVTCRGCRRTRYFLPADLVARYGDHEVDDITMTCPVCRTNRRVVVALYSPQPGDYGQLEVRRPYDVHCVKWRTVKLGDEVKRG